jgi:carbamoyl-phosphate synthase small subunit
MSAVTTHTNTPRRDDASADARPRRTPIDDASSTRATLVLADGSVYTGRSFGAARSIAGEVVFNTGMVGYVESLTDPSYRGQILVCTYPLVGNYGVPRRREHNGLITSLESDHIHAAGLVVADYSETYSHWDADQSLGDWLEHERVPAVSGIDTRDLTQRLRESGSMLGKLVIEPDDPQTIAWDDPNQRNLAADVAQHTGATGKRVFGPEDPDASTILLLDVGAKHNIVHSLVSRGVRVVRVPWDWNVPAELDASRVDGVMISNGPGDPATMTATVDAIRAVLAKDVPTFGICFGNQLLARAIGARTYKLKYGHRGQNQPVIECGTNTCFVTSQNHGYAVDTDSLPQDWRPWFENLNDGTNEGIRHAWLPFRSVQFHPEANPGPVDTAGLFDEFVRIVNHNAGGSGGGGRGESRP